MQINSVNGLHYKNLVNNLELGQRLLVEVISKKPSGEGIILLKGQEIPAIMEISAGVGDKLWAKIQEINDQGLLLVRDPITMSATINEEKPQSILLERGLLATANLINVLDSFSNSNEEVIILLQKLTQNSFSSLTTEQRENINRVLQAIPQWADVGEENGAEQILQLLKALGINYEGRLKQALRTKKENQDQELQDLLSTLKPVILKVLQNQEGLLSNKELKNFEILLDQLTGQQLWLRTGDQENAYILLHLPIQDAKRMYLAKVAIESTRKGNKMDLDHCHLAIQIQTEGLGDVGVDLWFVENNLSLRVLTNQPEILPPLLDPIIPLTKQCFTQIGFNLFSLEIGDLNVDQEFKRFILGQRKKGVDLHI